MKEIIEKYKNEELTLYEFLHNGYLMVAGDQWITGGGDRVVVKERALGVINKPQSTDIHSYVYKSFALDKEITAMEKQPEYEYVKVTESIFDLKDDFYSKGLFYYEPIALTDKWDYFLIDSMDMLLIKASLGDLYRRVEITPEQKREREVEELAKEACKRDSERDSQDFKERWDFSGELYKSIVNTVLDLQSKEVADGKD